MSQTRRGPGRRPASLLLLLALPLCGFALQCPEVGPVGLVPVAANLEQPVYVTAPWGDPRLFVVGRKGTISIVDPLTATVTGTFLDISSRVGTVGEQGLWSVAFPADYAETGHFYVYYQNGFDSVLSRFVAPDPAGDVADPQSEVQLLRVQMGATTALGGGLQFGPADGMLYVGVGEGGGSTSGGGNAQLLSRLRGKLLRLDVSGPANAPYAVPPDNPYVLNPVTGARTEIWALGLHDPMRMDFALATGDLWVPDRGAAAREEIHVIPAGVGGRNLGWPIHEGSLCARVVASLPCETPETASRFAFPIHEYGHGQHCRVVGGLPYAGAAWFLRDHFTFADACSDHVFVRMPDGGQVVDAMPAVGSPTALLGVAGLSRDGFGEPYLASRANGRVYWVRLGSDSDGDTILDAADNCPFEVRRDLEPCGV